MSELKEGERCSKCGVPNNAHSATAMFSALSPEGKQRIFEYMQFLKSKVGEKNE